MQGDDVEENSIDFIGYEWDKAVEVASSQGLTLRLELTAPPRGAGRGTLRVIRQVTKENEIHCTCAAEEWGDRPC